jgi:hypothetical protein
MKGEDRWKEIGGKKGRRERKMREKEKERPL